MLFALISFFCAIKDAVSYRLRGMNLGIGAFGNRAIWGAGLSSTYALTHLSNLNPFYCGLVFILAWLDMLIPHGFAMCMGNRAQKWDDMAPVPFVPAWGWYLPKWWPAMWMSPFKDYLSFTVQDWLGMASVAAVRASITFGVFAFFGDVTPWPFLIAIVGQPSAYAGSWRTPWAVSGFAGAYGAEWGEAYTGLVWSLAMGSL